MATWSLTRFCIVESIVGGRGSGPATTGWINLFTNGSTDLDLTTGPLDPVGTLTYNLLTPGAYTANITLGLDFATPCISLDGNPPISLNNLPSGFLFTEGNINLDWQFIMGVPATGTATLSFPPYGNSDTIVSPPGDDHPYVRNNIFGGNNISPTVFSGLQLVITSSGNTIPNINTICPNVQNNLPVGITGTYTIGETQYKLENADIPVKVGDKVKVTQLIPPFKLNTIDTITITSPDLDAPIVIDADSPYVITLYPDIIWFYIPIIPDHVEPVVFDLPIFPGPKRKNPITITISIEGEIFGGSVVLGSLTLLPEDSSGIYVLDKTKTNDTLYFREGFTTETELIPLSDLVSDDEIDEEEFFKLLPFPRKILAQDPFNDNDESDESNGLMIPDLVQVVVTRDVEIPSPFIRTAFVP